MTQAPLTDAGPIIDAAVRAGAAEWYGENWRMSLIRFMAASSFNPTAILFTFVRKHYHNLAGGKPMRVAITRSHPPCAGKAQDIYAALERFNATGATVTILALVEATGAYRALVNSTLANWQRDGTLRVALVPAAYERGSQEVVADLQALAARFAAPRDLPKPAQAAADPVEKIDTPPETDLPSPAPAPPPNSIASKLALNGPPPSSFTGFDDHSPKARLELVLIWLVRNALPMPSNRNLVGMANLDHDQQATDMLRHLREAKRVTIEMQGTKRRAVLTDGGATGWSAPIAQSFALVDTGAPKPEPIRLKRKAPEPVLVDAPPPAPVDIDLDDDAPPIRVRLGGDAELERLMAGRRYGPGKVRE